MYLGLSQAETAVRTAQAEAVGGIFGGINDAFNLFGGDS